MTSQRQVLPSMEKILMYDDYGATTYIDLRLGRPVGAVTLSR